MGKGMVAMSMCPLCNGLKSYQMYCSNCDDVMEDKGRLMDFFDDYSAYLDIDGLKLNNGIKDDYKNKQCPHVYHCPYCHTETVYLIQEE